MLQPRSAPFRMPRVASLSAVSQTVVGWGPGSAKRGPRVGERPQSDRFQHCYDAEPLALVMSGNT